MRLLTSGGGGYGPTVSGAGGATAAGEVVKGAGNAVRATAASIARAAKPELDVKVHESKN